jgi:hypothetical protein
MYGSGKCLELRKMTYNVEHYQGYQNQEDWLDRACSTHGRNENFVPNFNRKELRKSALGDLALDKIRRH